MRQICGDIDARLGVGTTEGRVYYNTVQCGREPKNYLIDEQDFPGIAKALGEYTGYRCNEYGASWSLSRVYLDDQTLDPVELSSVVRRINVGGPHIADTASDWEADIGNLSFANTGNMATFSTPVDASLLPYQIPSVLFSSEHWDPPTAPELTWSIPVPSGPFKVNLYFSENFPPLCSVGKRVFDIVVEDKSSASFDIFSAVAPTRRY